MPPRSERAHTPAQPARLAGGLSSAVQAGPSRSNPVKGLSAAYMGAGPNDSTNRYKYRGFNARIQTISISFRTLLEPHEQSASDQLATSRLEAARLFRGAVDGLSFQQGEAFSSEELSTQDARAQHSYFLTTLQTYSQTNLHREFLEFLSEVRSLVASFPLLLKNSSRVVEILLKHAAVPGSHAQKELFTLMSVLARDLRGEFVPYFGIVMRSLLALLDPSDASNIQAIFQTLASLFKYTARQLCEKVDTVFEEYYLELIGHHKSYIRHFASQSLAFLLRVAQRNGQSSEPAFKALLTYHSERENDCFKDGIASTLFEAFKNISFQFQASHLEHIRTLLQPLRKPGLQGEFATDIITRMHRRMANYTRRQYVTPIWTVLLERLVALEATLHAESETAADTPAYHARATEATRILHLLELWSSHRGGSRIPSIDLMTRLLNVAFGRSFLRSNQQLEWKRSSISMLLKYWRHMPSQVHLQQSYEKHVLPHLKVIVNLPVSNTNTNVVDEFGIENATLLLATLEASRDLHNQSGVRHVLTTSLFPTIETLLTASVVPSTLESMTRNLGLALLMELNGGHPQGTSYQIQSLDELQRTKLTMKDRKAAAKRRRAIEAGSDDVDEEDESAQQQDTVEVTDQPDDDADDDVEEEEVDSESYSTPLPQLVDYASSPYLYSLLKSSTKIQTWLLQQLFESLEEGQFTSKHITERSVETSNGSTTLLIGENRLTECISQVWTILQLMPASGLDVTSKLVTHGIVETKKSKGSVVTYSTMRVSELLQRLIEVLSSTLVGANSVTFTASTPIETDFGEDGQAAATIETNNHLLVGHQTMDQLTFLRSQCIITLAQLIKMRFSAQVSGDLNLEQHLVLEEEFDLLEFLRQFLPSTIELFRQQPSHIANLCALDHAFEMAKVLQVGGIVPSKVGTTKKSKLGASSSSSSNEFGAFFKTLFSGGSFQALATSFYANIQGPHAFLRRMSFSILRFFTTLRFVGDNHEVDHDGDDAGQQAASHRSELVGECPILGLMYDISMLSPTLEYEKEYVRLLKKVEVLINSNRVPEGYMKLIPSFLLGLMHFKLNPLWIHVQKILCSSYVQTYCVTPERQRWFWEKVMKVKLEEIRQRTQLLIKKDGTSENEEDEDEKKEGESSSKMDVDDGDEAVFAKHHSRVAAAIAASSAASSTPTLVSSGCLPNHSPLLLRFSHFVTMTSRSTDCFTYQSLLFTTFSLDSTGSASSQTSAISNGFSRRIFDKTFVQTDMIEDFFKEVWVKEWLICYPNTQRIEEGMVEEDERLNKEATSNGDDDPIESELDFYTRASSTSTLPVPTGYVLRTGSRKLVKTKLILFLKLFLACFHKTTKLPHTNRLKNLLLTLLANQEEEIQRLALNCLAKWKFEWLNPYVSTLHGLIAEGKWRETMTGFPLSTEAGMIAPEHRTYFSAVLIRILYPRLTQRSSGKASRASGLAQRRAAVLSYLGGLSHAELQHLVHMTMGGSFRKIINVVVREVEKDGKKKKNSTASSSSTTVSNVDDLTFEQILAHQIPSLTIDSVHTLERALLDSSLYSSNSNLLIPTSKQIGFLHMLEIFLKKLKSLSIPYVKFFVLQCTYMIMNAEIQIEKRKGQIAAQEQEAAAAAAAEEEDEKMASTEEKDVDEEDEDEDIDHEDDDDEEEEHENDAGDADGAADKDSSKKAADVDEVDLPVVDDDDDEPRRSRHGSSSKPTIPYALSKYLTELRSIRQLAFSRMATILDQYPDLFKPKVNFVELTKPKGWHEEEEEQKLLTYTGESLEPYLQFFISISWSSLLNLSREGTQHLGGLWSCCLSLSAHQYLLVHYLRKEIDIVKIVWEDAVHKNGLKLLMTPASSSSSSSSNDTFPLFTLLLDSLGARSVHTAVVGAILTISENLLRAKDDADDWKVAQAELAELESEREENVRQQEATKKKKKQMKLKEARKSGKVFDDESSEEDEDDEQRSLTHRLVQIETIVLSPASHALRSRQYWYAQLASELQAIWSTSVDKYLEQMHRWVSHLAAVHKENNGRAKQVATGSAVATSNSGATPRRGGPRQTFFPRRELEILSQISTFATSRQTAKKLIDLLLPFLHSPEKGHLMLNLHAREKDRATKRGRLHRGGAESDRYKPPPTLHHTLLRIMLALAPLIPVGDIDPLLDAMQRLLFSLKSYAHRSLVSELYLQLASGELIKHERYAHLPLLAHTVAALNAMNTRRIDEYDDARRLEVYASMEAAFNIQICNREIIALKQAKKASKSNKVELESIDAQIAGMEQRISDLKRQAAASVPSVSTATAESGAKPPVTFEQFDTFFSDYFSSSDDSYGRSVHVLKALLHNLSHDLLDDDLGTRSSAASMLKHLITFMSIPHPHAEDESNLVEIDISPFTTQTNHLQNPSNLLSGLLYPLLKRAIKNPIDKIRREVVLLLRHLILTFPRFYRSYLILVDLDTEKDFLENIVSIQIHARRKALTRLYQKITIQDEKDSNIFRAHESKKVDLQVIMQVLLPLIHHFVYDPASSQNVGSGGGAASAITSGAHSGMMSQSKQAQLRGAENTLLEESLKLASKLSAYMPWSTWFHQVQAYLKLMEAKPILEKTLVRLVCGFVREWHFEVEETKEERQLAREELLRRQREERAAAKRATREQRDRERALRGEESHWQEDDGDDVEDTPMPSVEPDVEPSPLSQRIRATLSKRLLPQLHGLLTGHKIKATKSKKPGDTKGMLTTYENQNELTSKSGMSGGDGSRDTNSLELVRVPVAMAMVALLQQLPRTIFHEEFPRLLTKLCLQLQHREQQARDLTRSTLLEILQLLGPFYFHFFVEELSRHLVNGYQIHVLGHVLWCCLDVLTNTMKVSPGSIDHSIVKLMDLLMNDLLGEPSKQKEIAAIRAATKEARINHAQDSFQLLAQLISFPGSIHYLIDPFRFKLAHDSSLRLRELGILSETLKHISIGLHLNTSVQKHIPELLVYIHSYLFRNVTESFTTLFPSQPSGKLSKADKKATSQKKNRYRGLDMTADKTPMELIRDENKARSEGKLIGGGSMAQRKALEFLLAIQSSEAGSSQFERTAGKMKPSKDETYLLVQPTPQRQTFDDHAVAKGHHSNLILVFGLNLLYYVLKNKRLNLGPTTSATAHGGDATSLASLSQEVLDNLGRLDPFLQLIRDYCLVMGSELNKDNVAGTRSRVTKEGEKVMKVTTLATSSSAVIHVALKCSEYLLQIQHLPSLNSYLRDLCNYMFGLIHSKSSSNILAICYKNLSTILKVCDWKICGISPEKQRLMLHFIKGEVLNPTATQATSIAFKLLQAILSRGVELEELYDLIITVSQLMVTSEVDEIRKSCSSAVYTFLYNYKLGANRMQTHFGFLLNQLSYPHSTGRHTVLQLLHSIFTHFHSSVLEEQLEFLFLPLVVHMVNENDTMNKKLSNSVISVLLSKISSTKQQEVMKMVYGWWQMEGSEEMNENKKGKKLKSNNDVAQPTKRTAQQQLLQFAALHIICIMIDLLKGQFTSQLFLGRSMTGLVGLIREKLSESTEATEADATEEESNDSAASWRVLYVSLLAVEKLWKHLPSHLLTTQMSQIHSTFFSDLLSCMTYPHAWVRTVACRIVGFILGAIPLTSFKPDTSRTILSSTLIQGPSNLFRLAKVSAIQLQSPHLSEPLAEQIVKNLVWLGLAAHNIGAGDIWENLDGDEAAEPEAEEEEKSEEEEGEEEEEEEKADDDDDAKEDVSMSDVPPVAASAASSKKRKSMAAAPVAANGKPIKQFPKSDNRLLNWLFTRLSYMCKKDDGVRMRESIFRYFATMSSQLPVPIFTCFLLQVLHPLYRLSQGQVRPDEVELQSFATNVLELIQTSIGTTTFLSAYSTIRQRVQTVRQVRQAKKKQLAVLHPDVAAQRKQAKHDLKRVAKKRKIQQLKLGRTSSAATAGTAINMDLSEASGEANKKQKI